MRRFISKSILCISLALGLIPSGYVSAAPLPSELSVDYSYYNPLSLVLKRFNWLEDEFKADHVRIRRVFSPGSDLALKNLQADSVNIASSAILSSVWSRAGGTPIKVVYIFTRAEWESIVVPRDSPINSVTALKGKRIAAAPGTDPYFFLLRALREAGLHKDDVVIVPMSHAQGRAALEKSTVDAWAGGVPYSAESQLENGFRVIYRNALFNSDGVLNVTEAFAGKYPEAVLRVIKVYEKARKWALRHPDDLEVIYSEEAKIPLPISRLVLSKFDFSDPRIVRNDIRVVKLSSPVLKEEQLINRDLNVNKVIDDLIDTSFVLKQVGPVSGR
jgi:sulfonate transport system substrate-binding protein